MGLDTVELIIEFEKRFRVEIPDKEWEQVFTVGHAAETIGNHKTLGTPERDLFGEIYQKVLGTLLELNLVGQPMSRETPLKEIFVTDNLKQQWLEFERKLGLKIPSLNKADFGAKIPEIALFGIVLSRPKPPFLASNLSRLVDCVCGLNYELLIDFDNISSRYEILVAVMGLTHKTCGVPIEEIFSDSSFTNDLGLG